MSSKTPPAKPLFLLTVSGHDQPGITSELTQILGQHPIRILDIAQAVIHPLLSLSILIEITPSPAGAPDHAPWEKTLFAELQKKAAELQLKFESQAFSPNELSPEKANRFQYAVTLIADPVTATSLHRVTAALARAHLNIDVMKRLSQGGLSQEGLSCVEIIVSSHCELDPTPLRKELLTIAKNAGVDIALQSEGLYRRAKRLVVLDMDSTLIQGEVIDELAREKGVYSEVSAITHQAMNGQMDYDESLRRRCAFLAGLPAEAAQKVVSNIELTPGARDLIQVLKKLGYKTALISGGFTFVADRLRDQLGIDYAYANTLEFKDGKITGQVFSPIVNAQRKADLLEVIAQQERIALDQVIAIGDGANDLLMLERAGLGIAFNAKPAVREQADLAISQKNLRSILFLLGLSGRDMKEAGL